MKNPILILTVVCVFALGLVSAMAAERKPLERDATVKPKAKAVEPKRETTTTTPPTSRPTASQQTQATPTSTPEMVPTQPSISAAVPMAGEQIKWQVLSGGGVSSSSASYKMSATVGQTAAGPVSSASYKLNQGYWQNFSSGGCCIGTTGNVNKSVGEGPDISDLSLLIAYLTVSPKPALPCVAEANINGAGTIDISDLSLLIAYLTVSPKPVLPNCP